MEHISNSEAALLGLLSEEPMHPYRIEQEVKYRDMRFWTELSMSSIYKLLRKLEKEGFTECTNKISEKNRLQKHYSISSAGKKALQQKEQQAAQDAEARLRILHRGLEQHLEPDADPE